MKKSIAVLAVALIAAVGCQPAPKKDKENKDKKHYALGAQAPVAPFDPANATALQVSLKKMPAIPDGHYNPGGFSQLAATATMKDGSTYTDYSIWKSLDAKASFGNVVVGNDATIFQVQAGDSVAQVEKSVTITVTAKSRSDLTASCTLAPFYGIPLLEFYGAAGADGITPSDNGKRGAPGDRGGDGPEMTVSLAYLARPSGAAPLVVVSGKLGGDANIGHVFDPAVTKVTIACKGGRGGSGAGGAAGKDAPKPGRGGDGGAGGQGGKGGTVTVLYDPAHPELKDLVTVDNGGGAGGSGGHGGFGGHDDHGGLGDSGGDGKDGDVGPPGPAPVVKPAS